MKIPLTPHYDEDPIRGVMTFYPLTKIYVYIEEYDLKRFLALRYVIGTYVGRDIIIIYKHLRKSIKSFSEHVPIVEDTMTSDIHRFRTLSSR